MISEKLFLNLSFKNLNLMRRTCLLIVFLLPVTLISQNRKFDSYYRKASIATFYSSNVLNSKNELDVAFKYLDSVQKYLDKDVSTYKKDSLKIESLKNELFTSKFIAEDNLNYRIPGFSILTGKREDINVIDDAQELLIESLTENYFSQADPLMKGTLNDNTHFFLINVYPFDKNLLGVILDFMSANSGHYAIRPHEISAILGNEGLMRYENDALNSEDYKKILDTYKISRIYNLSFNDKGSILKDLFYWGATLNTIDYDKPEKSFWKYLENFKKNKSDAFRNAILLALICLIFCFLVLRIFDTTNLKSLNLESFFREDYLINDSLIIFFSICSIALCHYIGNLISPDVNIFHGEISAKLWVTYQTVGFPLILFSILLLTSLKFGKIAATSIQNVRKIIFATYAFTSFYIIILNQFSSWDDQITLWDPILISVLILFPAYSLSNYFLSFVRGNKSLIQMTIFLVGNFLLMWSELQLLHQNYLLAIITVGSLIIALVVLNISFKSKKDQKVIFDNENGKNSILSDLNLIEAGFNYTHYKESLSELLLSSTDQLLEVWGTQGIGKTRLAKDVFSGINFFELDFSNKEENYSSFRLCFQIKNESLNLSENFFSKPVSFKKLSDGIAAASDFLPVNILKSINISDEDEIVSAREIAADLINTIIEQSKQESCLIVSNLNSITNENWALFHQFLLRLAAKPVLNKFKIIVINENETYSHQGDILKIFDGKELKCQVYCKNVDESIHEFLKNTNFSNQLKEFLIKRVAEINPYKFSIGKVIELISLLDRDNYLTTEFGKTSLINTPTNKYRLDDDLNYYTQEFYELNAHNRRIIECASVMGEAFDVNVLSNILGIDTLELLTSLEDLEKLGFISDDLNNKGVYIFQSNIFHEWILDHFYKNSERKSTQRNIEIKKRLVESLIIYSNEINVNLLDYSLTEILAVKEYDTFNESLKTLLIKALERFSISSSFDKLPFYLNQYMLLENKISYKELNSIVFILNKSIQANGTLNIYEIQFGSGKFLLDELIFDFVKNADNLILERFLEIILKDLMRRSHELIYNTSLMLRFEDIKNRLKAQNINSLRIKFYLLKIEHNLESKEDYKENLKKLAEQSINTQELQLASEIYRDLSIQFRIVRNHSEMLRCVLLSLKYFYDKPLNIDENITDFAQINKIILDFLIVKQSKEQAECLSYSINRLMEYLSIIGDFENILELSNYNLALNQKIKDHYGIKLSYLHRGKSLYELKRYKESLESYKEHFVYLSDFFNLNIYQIESDYQFGSRFNESDGNYWIENELTPIIEGVLFNCKELNDYSTFEILKNELYLNNIIISSRILKNKLYWYDSGIVLEKLLPENQDYSEPNEFSNLIVEAFLLFCKSDGEILADEFYNSVEYTNALQLITNESRLNQTSQFNNVFDVVDQLTTHEIVNRFEKVCEIIQQKHTIDTYKRFYFSLIKLSYTDNVLNDQEIDLLKRAKRLTHVLS